MPKESLENIFGLSSWPEDFEPNYNVAPTQEVYAIYQDSQRHIARFHWGLVPSWAKDLSIGNRLINARAETVATKPSFRAAFRNRRCLIPANGFYEWKKETTGKQPYNCVVPGIPMLAFAGLWEKWTRKTEETSEMAYFSFAIITTEAIGLFKEIHHRMPVILSPDAYGPWLDNKNQKQEALENLLKDDIVTDIKAYPVSKRVNSPRNNDPGLVEALI